LTPLKIGEKMDSKVMASRVAPNYLSAKICKLAESTLFEGVGGDM
jgi:hypothetical protein